MKLKKLLGDDYLECSIDMSDKDMRLRELEHLLKDASSLIDGCYEIVELFQPKSPSQTEWKRNSLESARKHGAS